MRNIQRTIEEVRNLRGDLSHFLIHLTRDHFSTHSGKRIPVTTVKKSLNFILQNDRIQGLLSPVGQFSHKSYTTVRPQDLQAVCMTETPIEQIYLFVNISDRNLKFRSHGLAFSAEELSHSPVHAPPVFYLSQPASRDFHFVDQFHRLERLHYSSFKDVLYLFDRFGKHVGGGDYNFRWEREWRVKGQLDQVRKRAKFGLCPELEIDYFEQRYPPLKFIDPFFHPSQIQKKLQDNRII